MTQIIGAGGGGGKGGGGSARTPTEAKDNLESTAYALVVDLLSEGEIEGFATPSKAGLTRGTTEYNNALLKDIYLDNTPILQQNASNSAPAGASFNFKNIDIEVRFGTKSQSVLSFGSAISEEIAVGLTVETDVPITRTITDTNVDQVRVTVTVPQLQAIQDDGDVVGQTIDLQVQVQYNGGGFNAVITDTIKGRTADQYQRDYLVNLRSQDPSNFPVDIRLVRTNAQADSARESDALTWTSYTEIIQARLNYPHSALVGLRVDADQFSSIPQRTYRIRGVKVKVPSNATVDITNGRITYSGVWNGTFGAAQWTTDPAWILWDLLTSSRYGVGDHVDATQLDKWAFYSASQYCNEMVPDGFGSTEPRFSCNATIQSPSEAYRLINDLCSVMRAMPYWGAGSLTLMQDRPADPSYLFTLANVTEEGFSYSGSDVKTRPNVAVVQYLDLAARETAFEQVEDRDAIQRYGANPRQVTAFACTSRGQAARLGEWLIYASQYETEVVSFTASIEAGVLVRPGQVIDIADPVRSGARRGGRIVAATTTVITIDNAAGLPASGTVSIVMPNGTVETKACTRSGVTLTLASALSKAPNISSIWVLNGGGIQTSRWRVLGVREQDGCTYEITALSYNASKYGYVERNRALQTRDVSNLNERPLPPTNLSITEKLYTYQNQVRAKIIITWRPRVGVNRYSVRWRKDNGNWNNYITQSPDHEILNITPGSFAVEVFSLNALSQPSTSALTGTINALGKTAPPSTVTGFKRTIDPVIGVLLDWNPVPDLDLRDYEIRSGGTGWNDATFVARVNATSYKVGVLDAGTVVYRIRARDTSNVLSTADATVTVTIVASAAPTLTHLVDDPQVTFTWTTPAGSYAAAYYELRQGASFAAGTTIARINGNSYGLPVTWSGARTFWIAAVDPVGTIGAAGSRVVTINAAAAPTVSAAFYGRSCTLSWNAVNGTLRTRFYEIAYGEVYEDRLVIARISSEVAGYSTPTAWSGARRFWVTAIDANGNLGSPGSVAATTAPAAAPVIASLFVGDSVQLSWSAVAGTLETVFYEVRRGTSWESAALVGRVNATYITIKASWIGLARFIVRAVDVNDLYGIATPLGDEGVIDVTIGPPGQPAITPQVIDNNVLLRWNDCTQSLPVAAYELRRGTSWDSAELIGPKSGGFTSVFEIESGTFTYWLAAIDTAGNYGQPGSAVVVVAEPPDYVLKLNQVSTYSGTVTNGEIDGTVAAFNVNTTETYEQHFTSRGWSTPQDQINDGYSLWLTPSLTTGSYEESVDYGAVVNSSKVAISLTREIAAGTFTITPTISTRLTTGASWTNYSNVSQVFASNFRYLKFRYDFTAGSDAALMLVRRIAYRLDNKLRSDFGNGSAKAPQSGTYSQTGTTITVTATAHGMASGDRIDLDFTSGTAADGVYTITGATANTFTVAAASATTSGNVTLHQGGTVVSFSYAFIDVESITVTPSGTAARIALYDFVDEPNPTIFKVLLFNEAGTRVAGGFSWNARGF